MILQARRTPIDPHGALEVVVKSDSGSLSERLERVSLASGEGAAIGFEIDPADGPPAALVAVAMVAGASAFVIPDDGDESGLAREVRRAADVTDALLVERAGS